MGLFSMLTSQFVDVIEWKESSPDIMAHRYDHGGKEIMMGAQLTVREGQAAVMVNEGRIADVFQPGRYELSTQNMPVMTALQSWKFGFQSPFKAEVYFINTHQFLDQKWGTGSPVMMRDAELGMVRLRAFGAYSFRVSDPAAFLKEVLGTAAYMTTEGVTGQIKRMLVSGLSDFIAQSKIPALDLAANYDELSQRGLETLGPRLTPLGLKLESFLIENISLPDAVEKVMDQRTSMGVAGDLNQYAQFRAAQAIGDAANNPSGTAGLGVGLGAGAMMAQAMRQVAASAPTPSTPSADTKFCVECGHRIPRTAKFCPDCGAKQS